MKGKNRNGRLVFSQKWGHLVQREHKRAESSQKKRSSIKLWERTMKEKSRLASRRRTEKLGGK